MPRRHFKLGETYDRFLSWLQPSSVELSGRYQRLFQTTRDLADLGCGAGNHLAEVNRPRDSKWIGVDSHQGSLDIARENNRYDVYLCADIITWLKSQADSSIDTVLASCVLEHLTKQDGEILLEEMKRVCSRRAVIFTPNGFVPQPPDPDNPANEHLSGWSVLKLKAHGFDTKFGINGVRGLRTAFALPRIRPYLLGDLIAKSTSRFAAHVPLLAYQVLAVHHKSGVKSD